MKMAKQFSLFVPHEAPIPEPEPLVEQIVETAEPKPRIQLFSEEATKIFKGREANKQKKPTEHSYKDFKLDSCRACGSVRLVKYDSIYLCRTCGSENSINGVMFGDKLKREKKI